LYRGYVASNEIGRLNIEFYNMQKFRRGDHVACPVNNVTGAWGDSGELCNTSVNSARTLE